MTDKSSILRLLWPSVALTIALIGLGVRLAFLHIGDHEKAVITVEKKYHRERKVIAKRGNIFDCNGKKNILALTLDAKHVKADPKVISEKGLVHEVAEKLSEEFDLPIDKLVKGLDSQKRYFLIRRFVPDTKLDGIYAAKLPGIYFDPATIRYYPQHDLLCHVLGFVNNNGIGSAGVEQQAHKYLRGCDGVNNSRVNAKSKELYWAEGRDIPAIDGADITLTIDQNVQFIVERALDAVMEKHTPKGAWAIVENVNTGEILAMASRPAYDLNEFTKSTDNLRLNRTIGFVYEPGSTFKAITFSVVFNENIVSENTLIDCEHGAWFYKGRILRDSHSHDKLTVADGLKKSSNILTAKLALMIGKKRFYKYLKDFGIGSKTGIDLPGEEYGILHNVSNWSGISLSRIAIGQGVAVTALQVLGVYCAIANGGYLVRPHVIKRIIASDGEELYYREPDVVRSVIKEKTAKQMRRLLARVTEDGGTGKRARVPGYKVAGKTGTAQKAVPGGYSKTDYVASFVGFIPADKPEIAIIVVVDTPRNGYYGGTVAGPAFSQIAEQSVRCLDIMPVNLVNSE